MTDSHTCLVLMTWQFGEMLVTYCVACPPLGIYLMFSSISDGVYGIWGGNPQRWSAVLLTYQWHILSPTQLITSDTDPGLLAKVFLHCIVFLLLPILFSWTAGPDVQPTVKKYGVLLYLLRAKYLHKLFEILYRILSVIPYLFIQAFISMNSWTLYPFLFYNINQYNIIYFLDQTSPPSTTGSSSFGSCAHLFLKHSLTFCFKYHVWIHWELLQTML